MKTVSIGGHTIAASSLFFKNNNRAFIDTFYTYSLSLVMCVTHFFPLLRIQRFQNTRPGLVWTPPTRSSTEELPLHVSGITWHPIPSGRQTITKPSLHIPLSFWVLLLLFLSFWDSAPREEYRHQEKTVCGRSDTEAEEEIWNTAASREITYLRQCFWMFLEFKSALIVSGTRSTARLRLGWTILVAVGIESLLNEECSQVHSLSGR